MFEISSLIKKCFLQFSLKFVRVKLSHLKSISDWLRHSLALTYADDTSTSVKGKTIEEVLQKLEEDAGLILKFMASNGLVANPKKTTFMVLKGID